MAAILKITKIFETTGPEAPVVSGICNVYLRGTTTPASLYTDATGDTTTPNPTNITNGALNAYVLEGSYDLIPTVSGVTYPAMPWEAVSGNDLITVLSEVTSNATAVSAETSRAEAAESTNATAIATERTRAETAESSLSSSISSIPIDPVPGTAGLRTLGTGADQAAAGNDSRFTAAALPAYTGYTGATSQPTGTNWTPDGSSYFGGGSGGTWTPTTRGIQVPQAGKYLVIIGAQVITSCPLSVNLELNGAGVAGSPAVQQSVGTFVSTSGIVIATSSTVIGINTFQSSGSSQTITLFLQIIRLGS